MSTCHLMDVKACDYPMCWVDYCVCVGTEVYGKSCTFPSTCYEFKTAFQKILIKNRNILGNLAHPKKHQIHTVS